MAGTPEPQFDHQLLAGVTGGQAALFLGAGFALSEHLSDRRRDKANLREHLLVEFRDAVETSSLDVRAMSMEDVVLYLETRGSVPRRAIDDSLRRFLDDSEGLAKLEAFTLLRTLFERQPTIFDTIVTTNWDTGVETALGDLPGLSLSVVSDDNHAPPIGRDIVTLFKIHGDISHPESHLVLSSADFDLFERQHPLTVERLRAVLSARSLLVLGYSAKDDNFRRLLRHLRFDLDEQFRGGWILSPALADREKLWTGQIGFRHISSTSQQFLRGLLDYATTDAFGSAGSAKGQVSKSTKSQRLTNSATLSALAAEVRRAFGLRNVWLVDPRSRRSDANARVDFTLACVLESVGVSARSIALSTGRTVEHALRHLDTSRFRNTLDIFSTVILLNAVGAFRDPSSMVDSAASLFGVGKCRSHVLRACGVDPSASGLDGSVLVDLGQHLLAQALESNVIVSSVRPRDWLGIEAELRTAAQGRTQPYDLLFDRSSAKINKAFERAGVVAIHQMIPLSKSGEDVEAKLIAELGEPTARILRPRVAQLRAAARSRKQDVILAASHKRKAVSVSAVLRGELCNGLVADAELAKALLGERE